MIENLIRFGGKYVGQETISVKQKVKISQELFARMTEAWGYVPCTKEKKKEPDSVKEKE